MYSTILQPGRALGYTVHTPAPALFTATVMSLIKILGFNFDFHGYESRLQ